MEHSPTWSDVLLPLTSGRPELCPWPHTTKKAQEVKFYFALSDRNA